MGKLRMLAQVLGVDDVVDEQQVPAWSDQLGEVLDARIGIRRLNDWVHRADQIE